MADLLERLQLDIARNLGASNHLSNGAEKSEDAQHLAFDWKYPEVGLKDRR